MNNTWVLLQREAQRHAILVIQPPRPAPFPLLATLHRCCQPAKRGIGLRRVEKAAFGLEMEQTHFEQRVCLSSEAIDDTHGAGHKVRWLHADFLSRDDVTHRPTLRR